MEKLRSFFLSCVALMLIGCGPTQEDAKKLGFENPDEMKLAQSQGYQTKALWDAHQLEIKDLEFAKSHGFETVNDLKAYKNADPAQKVVISAQNAINKVPLEEFTRCAGSFSAFTQKAFTEKNQAVPDTYASVSGMYRALFKQYLAQGKNQSELDNLYMKDFSNSMKISDISKLDQISVECTSKYMPYFAAKDISEYRISGEETVTTKPQEQKASTAELIQRAANAIGGPEGWGRCMSANAIILGLSVTDKSMPAHIIKSNDDLGAILGEVRKFYLAGGIPDSVLGSYIKAWSGRITSGDQAWEIVRECIEVIDKAVSQ